MSCSQRRRSPGIGAAFACSGCGRADIARGHASRCPRLDSRDVQREPALGRTSHRRRAPEIGNRGEPVERGHMVPKLPNLPTFRKSPPATASTPRFHRTACSCCPPNVWHENRNGVCKGLRKIRRSLDRTATAKRLSGERGAPVSLARSRFGLCARRDDSRGDAYSGRANGAAIAVAERLHGTRDRLDPTQVARSRYRGERGGPSPRADGLHRVLPALAHTSRPEAAGTTRK